MQNTIVTHAGMQLTADTHPLDLYSKVAIEKKNLPKAEGWVGRVTRNKVFILSGPIPKLFGFQLTPTLE